MAPMDTATLSLGVEITVPRGVKCQLVEKAYMQWM